MREIAPRAFSPVGYMLPARWKNFMVGFVARTVVAVAIAAAAGIFAFTLVAGWTGSLVIALVLAGPLAVLTGIVAWRWLPDSVAEAARSRGLAIVSLLSTALALFQVGRVAGYMVEPRLTTLSMQRSSDWIVHHSCLSAYYVASQATRDGQNLYDENLYMQPPGRPGGPPVNRRLGTFRIDMFEYPPPFLLVPWALQTVAPDFLHFRMIWFGLEGAVVLLGFLMVAAALGGIATGRALLLAPLPWAALPTLVALQVGNAQLPVIALSLMAMVLFERRRFAPGGVLLAYVTLSKLFPGLLLLYLAMRRQWRALAWTAGMGLALLLATLALVGWAPFAAFLDHLPLLLSGEAFPALRRPEAVAYNHSLVGLVFKLKLLGVWDLSFGAAQVVGWITTAIAAGVTIALARWPIPTAGRPIAWLVILIAATLRSPFLPQVYSVFPALWLLTLLAAQATPTLRNLGLMLLVWAGMNVQVPLDQPMTIGQRMALSAIPQTLLLAMAVAGMVFLYRRSRIVPATDPVAI
jgi:alpha-1,2-mannosyltransferase